MSTDQRLRDAGFELWIDQRLSCNRCIKKQELFVFPGPSGWLAADPTLGYGYMELLAWRFVGIKCRSSKALASFDTGWSRCLRRMLKETQYLQSSVFSAV